MLYWRNVPWASLTIERLHHHLIEIIHYPLRRLTNNFVNLTTGPYRRSKLATCFLV
jgi:hypothetical protein